MLSDYQSLVTDFVRDDASRISAANLSAAIDAALERYSQDCPAETAEDLVGVSGNLIALPTHWQADFSELRSLEHPVGKFPPTFIDNDAFGFYRDTDGLKIMLVNALASGSTVRAVFTVRHTLTTLADTIPARHRQGVAKFAAASLCDQLAAFYANDTDSTIGASATQGQSRSQAYAARARDYRKAYTDAIGVSEMTAAPASAIVTLRANDSMGQPFLYHPPRFGR